MPFDFDAVIDRRNTHCAKWDGIGYVLTDAADDTIPMWVADMDFKSPDCVNDAIRALTDHGVHGYFGDDRAFKDAMGGWMKARHGWTVDPDWVLHAHGLVNAIGLCVQAYSEPGDGVVVFSPVYHMFGKTVLANDRTLIESPLNDVQGRYEMDLDALAGQIDGRTKMVLLCSPHNPGGRVWTAEELGALADFCIEHDLILVSDEVHQDLVFDGNKHLVTAMAAPQARDRIVTLVAPTKTFNIAGALTGNAIAENPALREAYAKRKAASGALAPNRFGMVACTAAYQGAADWVDALVPYLQANRDRIESVVAAEIPGARPMPLESTYLSWINFAETGLSMDEVNDRIERKARIAINRGDKFGAGGETWARFNFACPRATLDLALERLVEAFRA